MKIRKNQRQGNSLDNAKEMFVKQTKQKILEKALYNIFKFSTIGAIIFGSIGLASHGLKLQGEAVNNSCQVELYAQLQKGYYGLSIFALAFSFGSFSLQYFLLMLKAENKNMH